MPTPKLGAITAYHLAEAVAAFKHGSMSLRAAAAFAKIEPMEGVDPKALETLAAVTDTNRAGVERVESEVKRLLSPETGSQQ